LHQVEGFVFDCDGVLWKGDTLLEGVAETLEMLRSMGKKIIFVTNNSTKSRKGYQAKFSSLGLTVAPEEIYSSSFAAAAYLEAIGFSKEKKVYVVGEVGVTEELELLGFQHLGGPEDSGKVCICFGRVRGDRLCREPR
jgi:phosphoglycolate phosphatase